MVYREVGPRIALQVSRRCSPTFALRSCSEAMVDSGGKSTELRADWLGACAWLCRFPGCDLGPLGRRLSPPCLKSPAY